MSAPKVIDAVSSVPVQPTSAAAIKVDTSGMAEMLQKMAEAQMAEQMRNMKPTVINPAAVIKTTSERMFELYSRYEQLQEIGRLLNGISVSDPLPETLKIEDITISFRIKEATGEYGDVKAASVKNVICTGDIYKLLSGEMGVIILSLEQETKGLLDVANKADGQYEKARKQWEDANPDRQIKKLDQVSE